MSASKFASVQSGPPIEVFALTQAFVNDTFEKKVNLGVGAYRTEQSQPWVLPIVRKLEGIMAADTSLNKEYLPVLGLPTFTSAATKMLLGEDSKALAEGRAVGVQSLSGTGALRVVGEFLATIVGCTHIMSSEPTWENHKLVFLNAGFKSYETYTYWDPEKKCLDLAGMLSSLRKAAEGTVVILHACAHNPTGVDPTQEEWKEIAKVVKERKLFPLFDSAYQGFASGDLDNDAWAVRYFEKEGFELICCQSFAKNFGLYNERVGNITIVTSDKDTLPKLLSQITLIIRGMYSNPPQHGARIVSLALNDPNYFKEWKECIQTMAGRIKKMRQGLRERLEKLGTPGDWSHVTKQIGMFSYTGLNEGQVEHLRSNYHIYMLKSGRINICGLTESNLDYVAGAIDDTVRKVK